MSRKLDALVAEKVMGWKSWTADTGDECWLTGNEENPTYRKSGWSPSTDIAAAWEVVEKTELLSGSVLTWNEKRREWVIGSPDETGYIDVEGCGSTPMLAICLAALRASGVSEKEIAEAMQ